MYDVHLGLIGKRVDFLIVIIELFAIDVTAEALRAKIDRKLAISLQLNAVSLTQNFRQKGTSPPIIFALILARPMNALQLCRGQFSQKETL